MRTTIHWRFILTAVVAIGIVSHLMVLFFLGQVTSSDALQTAKLMSQIGTGIFILWLGFEKWAWAWMPERIIGRPNLNGTWTGDGHFTFIKDFNLQTQPVSLNVKITIKQTYTTVFVSFWSKSLHDQKETTSEAYADIVQRSPGFGHYVLQYLFMTHPGAFIPNQLGFAALTYVHNEHDRLVGEWLFNPSTPAAGHLEVTRQ